MSKNEKSSVPKDRHIGLHGPRSTGKTCFWATCLYGKLPNLRDDIRVSRGSETVLKDAWDALCKGDFPAATAVTEPEYFDFTLQSSRYKWTIKAADYAGALVQTNNTSELTKVIRNSLVNSDGLMLFLDGDAIGLQNEEAIESSKFSEVRLQLTILLDEILKKDGNVIKKPLALVVTKWDLYYLRPGVKVEGNPFKSDSAREDEQKKLREFFDTDDGLKDIYGRIKAGENVELFPVSSFGIKGRKYQECEEEPDPFNLHAPIEWLARQSDENFFNIADDKAHAILQRPSTFGGLVPWRKYGKALRCYDELKKYKGIDAGPVYEKIKAEADPLRRKKNYRLGTALTVYALLIVSIVFGFGLWDAHTRFETASRNLENTRNENEVVNIQDEYHASGKSNPLVAMIGYDKKFRSEAEERADFLKSEKRKVQEDDFRRLSKFREEHSEPKDAELRVKECRKFLDEKANEGAPEIKDVEKWLALDERDLAPYLKSKEFDDACNELRRQLPEITDIAARENLYGDFVLKYPKNEYDDKSEQYGEIENILTEHKNQLFDDACDKLRRQLADASDIAESRKLCDDFIRNYRENEYDGKSRQYGEVERLFVERKNKFFDDDCNELRRQLAGIADIAEGRKLCNDFLHKYPKNEYGDKSEHYDEIDNLLAKRKNELFDDACNELRRQLPEIADITEGRKLRDAFVHKYPKNEYDGKLEQYEEIETSLDNRKNKIFDDAFNELSQQLAKTSDLAEGRKLRDAFLHKYPKNEYDSKFEQYEEIDKLLAEYKNKLFDDACNELNRKLAALAVDDIAGRDKLHIAFLLAYPKSEYNSDRQDGQYGKIEDALKKGKEKSIDHLYEAVVKIDRENPNVRHETVLELAYKNRRLIRDIDGNASHIQDIDEIIANREQGLDKSKFSAAMAVWNGSNYQKAIDALTPYKKNRDEKVRREAEAEIARIEKERDKKLKSELESYMRNHPDKWDAAKTYLRFTIDGTAQATIDKVVADYKVDVKWEAIEKLDEAKDYDKIVKQIDNFLDDKSIVIPEATRKKAEEKREKALAAWDKAEYEDIRDKVRKAITGNDPGDYKKAYEAADDYKARAIEHNRTANPKDKGRVFAKKVVIEDWINKFHLRTNGRTTITLKSVSVPSGALYWGGSASLRLTMKIECAGEEYNATTKEYKYAEDSKADPVQFSFNEPLALKDAKGNAFQMQWGKEAILTITVYEGAALGGTSGRRNYSVYDKSDISIMPRIKKGIPFDTHAKYGEKTRGRINILFSCPDFTIDTLPAY